MAVYPIDVNFAIYQIQRNKKALRGWPDAPQDLCQVYTMLRHE